MQARVQNNLFFWGEKKIFVELKAAMSFEIWEIYNASFSLFTKSHGRLQFRENAIFLFCSFSKVPSRAIDLYI